MIRGYYQNDRKNGRWISYYDNLDGAHIMIDGNYFHGKMHGKWLRYDENKMLRETETYFQGSKVGEWKFFDEQGNYSYSKFHKLT